MYTCCTFANVTVPRHTCPPTHNLEPGTVDDVQIRVNNNINSNNPRYGVTATPSPPPANEYLEERAAELHRFAKPHLVAAWKDAFLTSSANGGGAGSGGDGASARKEDIDAWFEAMRSAYLTDYRSCVEVGSLLQVKRRQLPDYGTEHDCINCER